MGHPRVAVPITALALLVGFVAAPGASALSRTTTLASAPTGVPDPNSSSPTFNALSRDGRRVFFTTGQKLTPDDTDTNRTDVYERFAGTTRLVSKPDGVANPNDGDAFLDGISADG